MKTLAERLAWAMRRADLDPHKGQSELARRVGEGCTAQTIQNIIGGGQKTSKYSNRIAEVLEVNALWLSDGRGVPVQEEKHISGTNDAAIRSSKPGVIVKLPLQNGTRIDNDELPHPTEDEFAFVPQLDMEAACGDGRFIDHVVVKGGLAFKRSSLRDFGVPEHAARIIYAAGGSMWPTIQDGCVVLVNTADTAPVDGKVYLICKPDGGFALKRLVRDYHPSIGPLAWIMRSDNPDKTTHPDKVLPPDDQTMIGGRAVWNDNRL